MLLSQWSGYICITICFLFKPFEISYRNKQYYCAINIIIYYVCVLLTQAGSQTRQQIILYAFVLICIFVWSCLEKQTSFHVALKHLLLFNYMCHWCFLSIFCTLLVSSRDSVSKREVLWTGWRWSVWVTTSSALMAVTLSGHDIMRSPACLKTCPETNPSPSNWSSQWRPLVSEEGDKEKVEVILKLIQRRQHPHVSLPTKFLNEAL